MQRNQRARGVDCFGARDNLLNQIAMPAMNAIERADGQNGRAGEMNGSEIADNFHFSIYDFRLLIYDLLFVFDGCEGVLES